LMNSWSFYTTVLPIFAAIILGVGYMVWLITASKQDAGIATGIAAAGAAYMVGYCDGKSHK
jgi:hypothetical protein